MKTIIFLLLFASAACGVETIFLDNHPDIVNGSTTYDPERRTCEQGKYKVFTDLAHAGHALSTATVLYVRAGTYSRASAGKYILVHGNRVNYWTGALVINTSGTPQKRKLVSAYKDELVIIQAKPGVSKFNPDPSDKSFKNSSHFYPHPAISIGGAYVDVVRLKTYGQVVISGHDITLQRCDLGGGGPHMNQGQVVAMNSNREGGVYNVVIRDNKIHHSCWGESGANGASIMGYNFSATIENNEFYDNYGPDIRLKDCGGQHERDIVIRFNMFRPTSININGNAGVAGIAQDCEIRRILIHNNLFVHKAVGISWDASAMKGTFAYNNTFVDCGEDVCTWLNPVINIYNNLHYHSRQSQKFYDFQTKPWSKLNANHNLFFSTAGDTQWQHLYRNQGSTLTAWQRYSGKDENSVWKDPLFSNPIGSRPEDFKRQGDPKDVTGSPYGSVCGAYVTDNEIIGLIPK